MHIYIYIYIFIYIYIYIYVYTNHVHYFVVTYAHTMHLNNRMGLHYYVLLVMIIVTTIYKKYTQTCMVRMNRQSHRHRTPIVLQSCTNA